MNQPGQAPRNSQVIANRYAACLVATFFIWYGLGTMAFALTPKAQGAWFVAVWPKLAVVLMLLTAVFFGLWVRALRRKDPS